MKSKYTAIVAIVAIVIIIGVVAAYIYSSQPTPTPGEASLTGSGATFPQPFLNSTIQTYTTQVRQNVQINYQGVGSGAGINAFTSKTVDFACTDAALTASQREAAPNAVHIPEIIGAIISVCGVAVFFL